MCVWLEFNATDWGGGVFEVEEDVGELGLVGGGKGVAEVLELLLVVLDAHVPPEGHFTVPVFTDSAGVGSFGQVSGVFVFACGHGV